MSILKRNFYEQPTIKVAQNLLGKVLKYGDKKGKIVETEAYLRNDAACHASRGMTERNKIMFGPAGHAYVYFTYGMHYCFNAVTQKEGIPEAVLIRAVEPLNGIRGKTDGPAKLCKALGIDKRLNGADLTKGDFVILDSKEKVRIKRAKRIGIKENADKLWRFYTNSEFVSKK